MDSSLSREQAPDDADAMRLADLSEEDLREAIRLEQAADPSGVDLATAEAGGQVSVVPRTPND